MLPVALEGRRRQPVGVQQGGAEAGQERPGGGGHWAALVVPTEDAHADRARVLAPVVGADAADRPTGLHPPGLALEAHDGTPFTEADLEDHWTLIFLGFTHCPDVCPFTLANLAAVRSELGQLMRPESVPEIVFLAVDPERDRPLLGAYVEHFDIAFTGITGEPDAIDGLTQSLDGFYRLEKKGPDDDAYSVTHSAAVSLVNPAGEVVAKLSPPFEPFQTATYINRLMRTGKAD